MSLISEAMVSSDCNRPLHISATCPADNTHQPAADNKPGGSRSDSCCGLWGAKSVPLELRGRHNSQTQPGNRLRKFGVATLMRRGGGGDASSTLDWHHSARHLWSLNSSCDKEYTACALARGICRARTGPDVTKPQVSSQHSFVCRASHFHSSNLRI
jgi:hypothetical protein